MWKYRQNFVENEQRKCINVGVNGDFLGEHIKVLYMEPDWTFQDFLKASSQRLNIVPLATRAFTVDGVEIDDCLMVEDNDMLFLSNNGDDFIMPSNLNHQQTETMLENTKDEVAIIHGYKVTSVLGKGGFGEVRLGEHTVTSEKVALKFLRKSDILTIGAAERTVTEIQCLATLKHQNIIKLLHHTESIQHVILIFELMEGGDLMKYLCKRGDTPALVALSEEECRPLFHQIVSGVSYAHNQHICHRDLKLENILLKGNNTSLVKIADFGLSDFYRPGSTMRSNCGTLSFLSPEVFRGTANAGPPLDIWSLGVILFCILCGRLPFEDICLSNRKRPRDAIVKARILKGQYKIDESLSTEVKDLLRRMMKLNPDERASLPEIMSHCWMRQHQTIWSTDSIKANNARTRVVHQGLTRSDSSKTEKTNATLPGKSSFSATLTSDSSTPAMLVRPLSAVQNMNDDSLNALISSGYVSGNRSPSQNRRHTSTSFDADDITEQAKLANSSTILSNTSASSSKKSSRDGDALPTSDHSSTTIASSGRASFTPSLPSLPQEPPSPISNIPTSSSSTIITSSSLVTQNSAQILQAAGLDIISPILRLSDEDISSSLSSSSQYTNRVASDETSPDHADNYSKRSPTSDPLISSLSDNFHVSQYSSDKLGDSNGSENSPIDTRPNSSGAHSNGASAPLKLIPLRRDRSINRITDDYQSSIIGKIDDADTKLIAYDYNSLSKHQSKYGKDDNINTDNDDNTMQSTNKTNNNNNKQSNSNICGSNNGTTRDVSAGPKQSSVKNFQRQTISSSQQALVPTTSRYFERDRGSKSSFAASSMSQHSMSTSGNIDTVATSPTLSPDGTSPLKTYRKESNVGGDHFDDDNDDSSIPANQSLRGYRLPRNSRRNSSSFIGSLVQAQSSSMNATKINNNIIGIKKESNSTSSPEKMPSLIHLDSKYK